MSNPAGLSNETVADSFQKGYGFSTKARADRQLEKQRDYALGDMGRRERAIETAQQDPTVYGQYATGDPELDAVFDPASQRFQDPLLMRFWNSLRKKRSAAPAQALPVGQAPMQYQSAQPSPYNPANPADYQAGFADGGRITGDPKKYAPVRDGQVGNAPRGRVYRGLPDPTQGVSPSRAARALNIGKQTGAGYAAGAAMQGSYDAYGTPTEQMAQEIGIDPSQVGQEGLTGLAKDTGIRAIGTMGRVGQAMIPDFMMSGDEEPVADAAVSPPPDEPVPHGPPSRYSAMNSAGASFTGGRKALPVSSTGEQEAPPSPGEFDMSEFSPEEVPNMSTRDWEAYRASSMRYARQLGMNGLDALQMVDQQITQMQQEGFINFAVQGAALQQAGDLQGAMSAYRAAYQYFPSGSDMKIGLHQGKIIGIGINEDTGKPEGQPRLIDPEMVYATVDNFKSPQAWQHWAKDRRAEQQTLRQYEEVVVPTTQSNMDYQATMGDVAQQNAASSRMNAESTAAYRAAGGAGGAAAGQSGVNLRDAQNAAERRLQELSFTNAELADRLQSEIAMAAAKYPTVPRATIIHEVLSRADIYSEQPVE